MTIDPGALAHTVIVTFEHKDLTPKDRPSGDLFAHAGGRICKKCDRVIEARQPARRRGETGWVHDACPDIGDGAGG